MPKRPGRTLKLSISLDKADVALLAERAERIAGGNLSAAVADVIRVAREWEGRIALAEWLGEGREEPSAEVREAIRSDWRGGRRRRRRSRAA
jgi:hypothetical protein